MNMALLELETIEASPIFNGDTLSEMKVEQRNRAKDLIEDFMIAANGTTARYLTGEKFPSLRRVVRIVTVGQDCRIGIRERIFFTRRSRFQITFRLS